MSNVTLGLHYERTQTGEMSRAWLTYLLPAARISFCNRGCSWPTCATCSRRLAAAFRAAAGRLDRPHTLRGGYNFDGPHAEAPLTPNERPRRRAGTPRCMSYRVLVLPQVETMTPALLQKIHTLAAAGATVIAPTWPKQDAGLSTRSATRPCGGWPPSCGQRPAAG